MVSDYIASLLLHEASPATDDLPGVAFLCASSVLRYLRDNELRLLQSDKEGCFVTVTESQFTAKAIEAVSKNFIEARSVSLGKAKSSALALCDKLGLHSLKKAVLSCKQSSLHIFCSVKTHKPGSPFRAIVSSKDSWQRCLGRHIQRALSLLPVRDPFLVKDSESL